ncbi:MAG TPA: ABC transporter permease [Vicinamibacterales bacterium]|jgi:predicted permease|nr:ABC transporter permease [Vicinamibacterales bacterium]
MLADLRYALRTLARRRGYAFAAIATLALGIAVNTTAFTLIDGLLLRPMPVPDAGRVVRVYPVDAHGRRGNLFSYPDYEDYRRAGGAFETLAAYSPAELTVGRSSLDRGVVEPRGLLGYVVSSNYFDLTGVRAAAGRVLQPQDDTPGARAVVVGHAFWRSRLGANPAAIGSTLTLNGIPFTVVGVAAPGFAGTEPLVADCWIALPDLTITGAHTPFDRGSEGLLVAGRLKRGVRGPAAQRGLTLEAQRLALAYPRRSRPASVQVAAGTFFTIDPGLRPIIAGVMGVVGLVLFIACANATNLALARAASRRKEIALRLALGAARYRIVRQLLVEAVLIGVAAGAMALLASQWGLRVLYRIGVSVAALPWAIELNLQPDIRVYAWTCGIALLSGMTLGLLPALQASSPRLVGAIHGQALLGGRMRGATLRHALVIAQVAASLVLLFGAGLLLRGLRSAEALDLGFKTAGVIYAEHDARAAGLSAARAEALNDALLGTARSLPGTAAAALTSHVPLHGGVRWASVRLIGTSAVLGDSHAIVSSVTPDYFAVLQVPFVGGHNFSASDSATPSVVISEGLARRFWPGASAIGKGVRIGDSAVPRTVIGVVRDASNAAIWREKELAVYLPVDATTDPRDLRLLLRTSGDIAAARRALTARAASIAADLRFAPVALDELLRLWTLPSKTAAAGVGVLAAMALTLACVGLYGVLTFAVGERSRELGIRMALGADGIAVVRLILADALRLVLIGLIIGTACALPVATLLDRLLFGVSPFDPLALGTAAAFLTAVALGTAYRPARRAARLDPLAVLRAE